MDHARSVPDVLHREVGLVAQRRDAGPGHHQVRLDPGLGQLVRGADAVDDPGGPGDRDDHPGGLGHAGSSRSSSACSRAGSLTTDRIAANWPRAPGPTVASFASLAVTPPGPAEGSWPRPRARVSTMWAV